MPQAPRSVTFLYFGRRPLPRDPASGMSGTHRSALVLAERLIRRGIAVTIAGNLSGPAAEGWLPVELAAMQHVEGPAVLVAGSEPAFDELSQSGMRGLVYWMQNPYHPRRWARHIRSGFVREVVCVSASHAALYRRSRFIRRVTGINNLIDQEYLQARRAAAADSDGSSPTVTFSGATGPSKGLDELLTVWLENGIGEYGSLAIAGDQSLHGHAACPDAGHSAARDVERAKAGITWLGRLDRDPLTTAILNGRAVVVNPKSFGSAETFSNAAAEALTLGRPVIGGRYGALAHFLTAHASLGWAVMNRSELRAALVDALTKPVPDLRKMQDDCAKHAALLYSDETSTDRWIALLARNGRGSPRGYGFWRGRAAD